MPRDGTPSAPKLPTREEILAQLRQQNSGHLIEQIINLEADKAVLMNEIVILRRRLAEIERATVEPTDAGAADL